jgi:hypothetical protein
MPGRPAALQQATGVTGCEQRMIRWLIVTLLALILISGLRPWLNKIGLGNLPGDFRFKIFGREFFLPITTTVVISCVASLIAKWL